MRPRLNPDYTFDTFVIGAGNRLAASAARRSAENPGTYNPLVIHGPSGMGKTHLLHALGQKALEIRPELEVVYESLESFVDRLSAAIAAGRLEHFRKEYLRVDLLLLDDGQFLTGKVRTQEELLPVWDAMGRNGAQVVFVSDRPPTQIDGLDVRLGARFARGLVVDIVPPDVDTRTSILLRQVEARGAELHEGIAPALARLVEGGGRDLEQGLERILSAQQKDGTAITVDRVAPLLGLELGAAAPAAEENPFENFLTDISATVAEVVDAAPWRNAVAEAMLRWEGDGMRTWRLENALAVDSAPDVEALLSGFEADAARLLEIGEELAQLDPRAATSPALRDPDRRTEAETLLLNARLSHRPLPLPPPGLTLANFAGGDAADSPVLAVARRVGARLGSDHNPLFAFGSAERVTHFLAAIGNAALAARATLRLAFLSGVELADELARVLEAGYLEVWRRRYEKIELLLIDRIEALAADEASQEALLELIDSLLRTGGQVVLSAGAAPREVAGLDPRLLSRCEGGTVLDLARAQPGRLPPEVKDPQPAHAAGAFVTESMVARSERWYLSREKLAWGWVALEDRLIEEFD